MRKACSFLIVCLLASCKAPQQLVTKTETVIVHDTLTLMVAAPVPATENTVDFFTPWENSLDSFFVEDSASFAEVVMRVDTTSRQRHYTIKHGRKADTVFVQVPIVVTDTVVVPVKCPELPIVPERGKFPWSAGLIFLAALVFWWVGKRKKESSSS